MNTVPAPSPVNQIIRLRTIQFAVVSIIPIVAFSTSAWPTNSFIASMMTLVGQLLLAVCILGRLWSILYSGGRKNRELVMEGPYSVSRNPLYLFSTIGASAIGLILHSFILAASFGVACGVILSITSRREATYLETKFGAPYQDYARRVPAFWPDFRLYRERKEAVFNPAVLRKTFLHALYFLLVIPLMEIKQFLVQSGIIPSFFHLL
ncbi:methyltransferase family protein [Phyllobacterium endophyticum]|uniref:Isoprenylcysteine carboxylmethyltransferase family protein n=1 Tax=Phyllobacterium endophyticum TaxID=1149773 RepID=A0A2P7AS50_9HYPH|nr:isoprenylcysteine carboxylmethyltransferase family protein [Phyllobacterium endophyticum]MBB3236782.1 protein-S-isoprenylcysteine O-methyltransferase Ste14 [Phyllobacterium endophyticum]PSH57055.1 isoprenylcysteine carboxylmethyltransferase family protein [Phyllobacterium endophyticum]TYR40335.1 isoprenylcysteine carboxylmethyltransferase family protein [Phyllobacterium endophyticum]